MEFPDDAVRQPDAAASHEVGALLSRLKGRVHSEPWGGRTSAAGRGDGQKFGRFQTRAADQRALDIVEGEKFAAIVRLDRAAVQTAHLDAPRALVCPLQ